MNVESWCLVEATAKQSWKRAQRKHFPNALESTVFDKQLPNRFEERSAKIKMEIEEEPKKKHFPEKCKQTHFNSASGIIILSDFTDETLFQI